MAVNKFGQSHKAYGVDKFGQSPLSKSAIGFKLTTDNNYDILGNRLINVGNPVNDYDATNHIYVKSIISEEIKKVKTDLHLELEREQQHILNMANTRVYIEIQKAKKNLSDEMKREIEKAKRVLKSEIQNTLFKDFERHLTHILTQDEHEITQKVNERITQLYNKLKPKKNE